MEEARKIVFEQKPAFGSFCEKWKEKNWLEYYEKISEGLLLPSNSVLSAIEKEASAILGDDIGKMIRSALLEKRWVDTADHHGIMMHPYFYSDALARSHPRTISKSNTTVVLSFGNISLSNDSFPRGLFFKDKNFHEQRVYFQSLRQRRRPVFGLPAFSKKVIEKEIDRARTFSLSTEAKDRLISFLEAIKSDQRMWKKELYSEQLTLMNDTLWKKLFGAERGNLVYLEIDAVVRTLLLEKHLVEHTPIFNLLFKKEWRESFKEIFDSIQGSHIDNTKGTHLFWYIDKYERERKQLFIEGEHLASTDKKISIPLRPEIISEHIFQRTLMPSTALLLIVVHAVEHLACGGGFSQIQYLRDISEGWKKLLEKTGVKAETPYPSIFSGEYIIAGATDGTSSAQASLIDLLLYGKDLNTTINRALEETSVQTSIDAMMPDFVKLVTGKKETIENYLNIPLIAEIKKE